MIASAVLFGVYGLALLFAPVEVMGLYDVETGRAGAAVAQHVGTLLIAFGTLNWNLRDAVRGGIYGQPIAAANLTHLFAGTAVLANAALDGVGNALFWAGIAGHALLTLGFAWLLFGKH